MIIKHRRDLIVPRARYCELTHHTLLGSGGPTGFQYWRVYITANNGNGSYTTFKEMEMATSVAGTDETYNDTPLYLNVLTSVPGYKAQIFNNNTTDLFLGDINYPVTAGFNFGAPKSIVEVRMYGSGAADTSCPKNFEIQASNDNSSWTTKATFTNVAKWAGWQTFSIP